MQVLFLDRLLSQERPSYRLLAVTSATVGEVVLASGFLVVVSVAGTRNAADLPAQCVGAAGARTGRRQPPRRRSAPPIAVTMRFAGLATHATLTAPALSPAKSTSSLAEPERFQHVAGLAG